MTKKIFLIIAITLSCLNIFAQIDTIKLNISNKYKTVVGNQFIKFYHDNSNSLDLEQIQSLEFDSLFTQPDSLSIYKKNTNIWFKFYVKNQSDKLGQWILAVPDYAFIDYYIIDSLGNVENLKAGTSQRMSQKQLRNNRLEIISIYFQATETKTIYVKATSEVALKIQDVFLIQNSNRYYESLNQTNIFQGFFHGFLLALFLYNLILFLMTKQKSYIFYSLYIILIILSNLAIFRYFTVYIFPENPVVNSYFGYSIFFALIFYFLFIREFIESKHNNLKLDNFLKRLIFINILFSISIILISFFNYFIFALLALLSVFINMIIIFLLTLKIILKGGVLTKIFALGAFVLIISILTGVISRLLSLNQGFVIYVFQSGIAIEGLIFTIGLSYKYKLSEDKIKNTQSKLIEQYMINESLQKKVTAELEKKVAKRTQYISKQNKEIKALYQEIHHRVKNSLQTISSLIYFQLKELKNDNNKSGLKNIQSRVDSMAAIHEMLYSKEEMTKVSLKKFVEDFVSYVETMINNNAKVIEIEYQVENIEFNISEAITLGLMISEIITNALKHAFEKTLKPRINIKIIKQENEEIFFSIKDNGSGVSEEILGSKEKSLGFKLINIFSRQLNSVMKIKNNNGLEFKFTFKLKKDE
ncbi:MAG: hypothetical protein JXR68_13865 [Bacteroidales bacterium]|nr:hypothetical protein [Bacteroidales bacterium]